MNIREDISLRPYNTFGIEARAKRMIECETDDDVVRALEMTRGERRFVLGGGSNVLLMSDFEGTVLRMTNNEFDVERETDSEVRLCVGAGYEWDAFVARCVEIGWQGAENLSAIPGTVGASPVQNIGAYGVEAKDVIESVEGFFCDTIKAFRIGADECEFGYRSSVFKTRYKGNVVITRVHFCLRKSTMATNLNYGLVSDEVKRLGEPTIANVRKAIIGIRDSKLPDPKVEGNAGSFFKNPVVETAKADQLRQENASMPVYPIDDQRVKLSAAWLIDQCGWKGRTLGRAGVHSKQALVLVNKGNATGNDIMTLARQIQSDVRDRFGVEIEMEVNSI